MVIRKSPHWKTDIQKDRFGVTAAAAAATKAATIMYSRLR
jgi:hypothetical protein